MNNPSHDKGKKKKIIDRYNLTSNFYEQRYSKIQSDKFNIILKIDDLNNKTILDSGCGTGLLFDFIFRNQKNSRGINYFYVGVDISINMLRKFHSKLNQKGKKKGFNIGLILSDLENLPLRNIIFNQIFSITSLQNLPNMMNGINETFRVLQQNGDIRLSILKKNLDIAQLLIFLKGLIKDMKVIIEDNIEDNIILGRKK
jgi:ubiquinone/menaquinone biosynthesis C-methylase UbiE